VHCAKPIGPKSQGTHFGTNRVTIFQGAKIGIIQQIFDDYVAHMQGIQCMVHHTNLIMQVLSKLNMVNKLENLSQTLYALFYKSPKRHLDFNKLAKIMEIKGNRPPNNVKTRWISMLDLAKRIMGEYHSLIVKMMLYLPFNSTTTLLI
jgi:hypothetical protein